MKLSEVQKIIEKFIKTHRELQSTIDFVVGISRGGLIPAALIAARLDKPLVAVYIDRQDRVFLDRGEWIRGKRVLLVDDIVRTGATFSKMQALLKKFRVYKIYGFTLFTLRGAKVRPTWTTVIPRDKKMPWDF